jgi:hypothetical protein
MLLACVRIVWGLFMLKGEMKAHRALLWVVVYYTHTVPARVTTRPLEEDGRGHLILCVVPQAGA